MGIKSDYEENYQKACKFFGYEWKSAIKAGVENSFSDLWHTMGILEKRVAPRLHGILVYEYRFSPYEAPHEPLYYYEEYDFAGRPRPRTSKEKPAMSKSEGGKRSIKNLKEVPPNMRKLTLSELQNKLRSDG